MIHDDDDDDDDAPCRAYVSVDCVVVMMLHAPCDDDMRMIADACMCCTCGCMMM